MGIVTAIGLAHYERFKALEIVAEAKFELAEAVTAEGGTMIAAADTLAFAAPRRFAEAHSGTIVTVGAEPGAAVAISELRQDADGIAVTVAWQGNPYRLSAPLYGLHQGRTIALAFAAACTLGIAPEDGMASLTTPPQIAHRLEGNRHGNET